MSALDGICHEKHVPINIDTKTRERLGSYLLDKAPRGQGYTAFIEQALNIFGAEAEDDSHSYDIAVWDNHPDTDEAFIFGKIQLTEAEAKDLEERLDRFSAEDVIGHYALDRSDAPAIFAVEGIYNFITGDLEHADADLRALWDGTEHDIAACRDEAPEGHGYEACACICHARTA